MTQMDGQGVISMQPVARNDQLAVPFLVAQPASSVAVVLIKLLPFWPNNLQLWFMQVDAQINTKNITTKLMRFKYIVGSLSPEYAMEVRDILPQPPMNNPNSTWKAALIKHMILSEHYRFHQLLTTEDLGDQRPTQLLRHMQQLLGDCHATFDQSFLHELFLHSFTTTCPHHTCS